MDATLRWPGPTAGHPAWSTRPVPRGSPDRSQSRRPGSLPKGTFFGESGSTGRVISRSGRPLSEDLRQGGGARSGGSEWNRADRASDSSRPTHVRGPEGIEIAMPARMAGGGRLWAFDRFAGRPRRIGMLGEPVRERVPELPECGILAAAERGAVRDPSADAGRAPSPRRFRSAVESRLRIVGSGSGRIPESLTFQPPPEFGRWALPSESLGHGRRIPPLPRLHPGIDRDGSSVGLPPIPRQFRSHLRLILSCLTRTPASHSIEYDERMAEPVGPSALDGHATSCTNPLRPSSLSSGGPSGGGGARDRGRFPGSFGAQPTARPPYPAERLLRGQLSYRRPGPRPGEREVDPEAEEPPAPTTRRHRRRLGVRSHS